MKAVQVTVNNSCCHISAQSTIPFNTQRSTVHPMIHFMNKITNALENKWQTIAIFCDLRKAFDLCNHNILIRKLGRMGLSGVELLWFENYLTNGQQHVFLNGSFSSFLTTKVGVPSWLLFYSSFISMIYRMLLIYSLYFSLMIPHCYLATLISMN